MRISDHISNKKLWKRRVVGDSTPPPPTGADRYETTPEEPDGAYFRYLTQEDFMREIEPGAHDINSKYQSTRPIKELVTREVEDRDENGNVVKKTIKEWVITGWDDLETTRYGLQKRFAFTKAAHFAGDGFYISNEQTDQSEEAHKRFDKLNSWKDIAGYDTAIMEAALSCFQTGDFGLYPHVTPDGSIEYMSYSYLDGFQIFPDVDENRNEVYYVLYSLKGKPAVDVFKADAIETWVQTEIPKSGMSEAEYIENFGSWWEKVKYWFKTLGRDHEVSEDNWHRVARRETQTPAGLNQFVYFRVPDIPSGVAQEDISALERTASYVAEGVKSTTFDTMFVKAPKVKSLPGFGGAGSVLAVEGDVESLKAADAKRIAPSDVSNVATIDIKEKKDSILHSTMSVIVDPDILRSGADSSSAMRLCFNDEVKWCMTMQPHFYKPLKKLVAIHKALVAKIEGDGEYLKLRTSVGMNIWVPSNTAELIDNTTKLVYSNILSCRDAATEVDLQYLDTEKQIRKEQEDKIYRETYIKLKAEADARRDFGLEATASDVVVDKVDNPVKEEVKPKVDNNASNKGIAKDRVNL